MTWIVHVSRWPNSERPIQHWRPAGSTTSTKPTGRRYLAIDTKLAPELIHRFLADLGALLPGGLEGKRLGLAVSGGPDSLAMLLLAAQGLPGQISAASIDHGLRPESGQECELVAGVCADLGVPHTILPVSVDVGNIQEQARKARYAALAEWARSQGIDTILTAHHADDQAETLLMRLNRGAGLAGLAGVRPRRKIPGSEIVLLRPLLAWRKAELEEVACKAGVDPVRDPSNADERFDRARIRKVLTEADWLDVPAIAASAANLADGQEALEWAIDRELREQVRDAGDTKEYRSDAPFALQLKVVSSMIEQISEAPRLGSLARLMRELQPGEHANIAGCLLRRTDGSWHVSPEPERRN